MIGNGCGCYWTCRPDSEGYHIDHATSTVPAVVARAVPVYMLRRTPPSHCGTLQGGVHAQRPGRLFGHSPPATTSKTEVSLGLGRATGTGRAHRARGHARARAGACRLEASPSPCLSAPELAKLGLSQVRAAPGLGGRGHRASKAGKRGRLCNRRSWQGNRPAHELPSAGSGPSGPPNNRRQKGETL
jgi:hypothetical protein